MPLNNDVDFLIIGAQKCATTWLYECLKEHPDICLPKNKKEREYIGGKIYKEKGIDWYLSLMGHAKSNQIKGDVSVEYLWDETSSLLLKNFFPALKLIVSIRNPADRALSAYYWYVRRGLISNKKNVINFFYSLKDAYLKNNENIKEVDIIKRGLYFEQLSKYFEYFDLSNILVILYEDIELYPLEVLKTIFNFLGVNNNFVPDSLNKRPKKNSYVRWLLSFERLNPKSKVISGISNKLNQIIEQKKNKLISTVEENEVRKILNDIYSESILKMQQTLDVFPKENQPITKNLSAQWKIDFS